MRIAYLILAHNNPGHLNRLIQALQSAHAYFYVHVDKKTDIGIYKKITGKNVIFCSERIDCIWGNISLVDASLVLVKSALAEGRSFDYFVLLSGACYPVQPREYIEDFFERHKGREFIEAFALPNFEHGKKLERLSRYWIKRGGKLDGIKWRLQKFMNSFFPERDHVKHLNGAQAMAGSQWWALSHEAVNYVVGFIADNPSFYNFCKHTDCPDEFVFQTILWNSRFREKICHSLTFTHWEKNKSGPEEIDAAYMPIFERRTVLDSQTNNCPNEKEEVVFARKFSDRSGPVLDLVDGANLEKAALFLGERADTVGDGGASRASSEADLLMRKLP